MPGALIVRLPNWLGDTVMAIPLVRSVRAARPDQRLALVGPWAPLLAGQGIADEVMRYPRSWGGRLRASASARALDGETIVLCPNSFESAFAGWWWGARRRIGFAAGGRVALLTDPVPLPSPRRHQIDEYLLLLAPLEIPAVTDAPLLAAPGPASDERVAARALLAAHGIGAAGRRPLIGVHLGAAWGPSKRWPTAQVAGLCTRIRAAGGTPVLLGTAAETVLAAAVVESVPVADLVGRDSPEIMPALLAELDALVCADTGVGHLAAALGTPVVALFGPTDPTISAPRGPVSVVRHEVPCAPCYYRVCPIDHPCMRDLEPDAVMAHLATASARWTR